MNSSWKDGLILPEAEQLTKRIAVPAGFFIRGMFLANTIELSRRVVGSDATAELLAEIDLVESDIGAMKKAPLAVFNRLREAVGQRLLRHGSNDIADAMAEIGSATVDIFFESVAGRTMKILSGSDPHRLFSAAPNGYKLAISDNATRSYRKSGERSGVFAFVGDWLGPAHHVGVFRAATLQACSVELKVTVSQSAVESFDLEVEW